MATSPVSVSTSTAHRWVPCGKEKACGSKVASLSSEGSTPSGRLCAANTARAQSASVLDASGEPLTRNAPSANSTSAVSISSMCAAMTRAFSRTFWLAITSAMPPTASEREP